jgi:hypothetical protein
MELHYNKKLKVDINVTKMSSLQEKYKCEYCCKILASRQSKWRHNKSCNMKSKIEKRIEVLEDKIISNIDIKSIVIMMNSNIQIIKTMSQIADTLYYNETLKKILNEIKQTIKNNVTNFQVLTQNKNKFDKYLRDQINYNLGVINKLESYTEYIEYNGKKQHLFKNHVNLLKEIYFHEEEIKSTERYYIESDISKNENILNSTESDYSSTDSDCDI